MYEPCTLVMTLPGLSIFDTHFWVRVHNIRKFIVGNLERVYVISDWGIETVSWTLFQQLFTYHTLVSTTATSD
jgi:hypothetical protein